MLSQPQPTVSLRRQQLSEELEGREVSVPSIQLDAIRIEDS
jgi:hypothetical protein